MHKVNIVISHHLLHIIDVQRGVNYIYLFTAFWYEIVHEIITQEITILQATDRLTHQSINVLIFSEFFSPRIFFSFQQDVFTRFSLKTRLLCSPLSLLQLDTCRQKVLLCRPIAVIITFLLIWLFIFRTNMFSLNVKKL